MPTEPIALAQLSSSSDYLRVALNREIVDLGEAKRFQIEVTERAAQIGVVKVLFDYRRVGSHDEAVRTNMWHWAARSNFVAMALLVANDLIRVRMNMTALAQKVRMRAFLKEPDALAWLIDAERRKPTTEIPRQ